MINMIKADLYRIVRNKAFYVGVGIMLLMIGISIYQASPGYIGMTGSTYEAEVNNDLSDMSYEEIQEMSMGEYRKIMLDTEGYELDRNILASNMNLYYVFIFIAAIAIAADFSSKAVKNTLSSAISRNRYFLSKLVFVNICCVVLFFLNTYLVYFLNIICNSKNIASSLGTVTKISFLQLPPILSLVSILTGLAFALKKSAFFNTVAIPLVLVFQIALNMGIMLFKIPEKVLDFELQNMLFLLAGNPSDNYLVRSYLLCGGIMVGFYLIGYLFFRKAEIK